MTIYAQGTNQHKTKVKNEWHVYALVTAITVFVVGSAIFAKPSVKDQTTEYLKQFTFGKFAPLAVAVEPQVAGMSAELSKPATTPNIVQYIAQKWEKHGTGEVVKAINCFYSESGLRPNAVGQNTDGPKSKDYGVAQLNGYWHNLSELEKTNFIANIDRAYKIYTGRGNSWSAWYGKGCK